MSHLWFVKRLQCPTTLISDSWNSLPKVIITFLTKHNQKLQLLNTVVHVVLCLRFFPFNPVYYSHAVVMGLSVCVKCFSAHLQRNALWSQNHSSYQHGIKTVRGCSTHLHFLCVYVSSINIEKKIQDKIEEVVVLFSKSPWSDYSILDLYGAVRWHSSNSDACRAKHPSLLALKLRPVEWKCELALVRHDIF